MGEVDLADPPADDRPGGDRLVLERDAGGELGDVDEAERQEIRRYREESDRRESSTPSGGVSGFGSSLLDALKSPRTSQRKSK